MYKVIIHPAVRMRCLLKKPDQNKCLNTFNLCEG